MGRKLSCLDPGHRPSRVDRLADNYFWLCVRYRSLRGFALILVDTISQQDNPEASFIEQNHRS
jgi:hypothetical protein